MNKLISKIEYVVERLLLYEQTEYAKAAEELVNMMISEFPVIISYYAVPEMSDYAKDAEYWPGQLERVLNALNAGDDLATADILYCETRANLIELRDILKEKGLI